MSMTPTESLDRPGIHIFHSHRATPSHHPYFHRIFLNEKQHPAMGVPPVMAKSKGIPSQDISRAEGCLRMATGTLAAPGGGRVGDVSRCHHRQRCH